MSKPVLTLEARYVGITRDGIPDEITISREYVERSLSWIDGLDAHEGRVSTQNIEDLIAIAREFAKGYTEYAGILKHVIADRERIKGERNDANEAAHSRESHTVVKPLVWEEILQQRSEADPTTEIVGYEASTGFCTYYTIELCAGSVSVTGLDYEDTFHDTEEEAKAAAQADFNCRVLACLEIHP